MSAESTTFIIDVSPSMFQNNIIPNVISYLEYTLIDKVKRNRKTDYLSLYLANHYGFSKNSQDIPNIFQLQEFTAPVTMEMTIEILKSLIGLSAPKLEDEDAQDSSMLQCLLVTSLDIKDYFGKRKINRQIVIFTDDINGLDITAEELEILREELESKIILIDCSGCDKLTFNESSWGKTIASLESSLYFTIAEFSELVNSSQITAVKPVKVFTGLLRLGADILAESITNNVEDNDIKRKLENDKNNEKDTYLSIKVEGYPATKTVSNLSMKTILKPTLETEANIPTPVQSVVEYMIKDEQKEENGKSQEEKDKYVNVSPNSVSKAFRYGSDYVILPAVINDQRTMNNKANIDIRGFMNETSLPRYFLNSESKFIFFDSRNGSKSDVYSMYALVDVLMENKKIAIVRYVQKHNGEVEMCALYPMVSKISDRNIVRYFVLNRLPFAEDERVSDFPKLVNRLSTSGKLIEENKEEEDKIDKLMSDFVDLMDTDDMKSIPNELYYRPIDGLSDKTSVLPLPNENKVIEKAIENDPTLSYAISLYLQKSNINAYIHNHYIVKGDKQQPKVDTIFKKINPHFNETNNELIDDLKDLLNIKKVELRETIEKEVNPTDNIEVPSFESLMERGKR
ncbi:hypothetical protein TPHA_0G02460 [Tetrapisispora phaffii CBS 4417]|uniref:DNA helicase n=1 Tax=Tetrapisispora phaffii (strain ATCC 24235 / CBS 4417 / NBRC 1672 / NRRL Y-8282 / UCD 70-5) TaxID=1071381 RepID=G8BW03_TETPH|nr:hypothetical protein TPHA_0G02460 [Tetrapisispora phaffii CBS 4417]CCE64081.1 hypothetical protein TPHA_0G02460 [Tetrapisispora phaffii CBS 4417]